ANPAAVGFAALPIAAVWLAIAIALWRIYPTLLLEVVATNSKRAVAALSLSELVDPSTVRVLAASLVDADLRRCRAACALVVEAPRSRAVAALARAIAHAPAANRPLLIETRHGLLERTPHSRAPAHEAAQHLEPLLTDPGPLTPVERAHLVESYARLVPSLRPGRHGTEVLTKLLNDPAPAVRLAALVQLHEA